MLDIKNKLLFAATKLTEAQKQYWATVITEEIFKEIIEHKVTITQNFIYDLINNIDLSIIQNFLRFERNKIIEEKVKEKINKTPGIENYTDDEIKDLAGTMSKNVFKYKSDQWWNKFLINGQLPEEILAKLSVKYNREDLEKKLDMKSVEKSEVLNKLNEMLGRSSETNMSRIKTIDTEFGKETFKRQLNDLGFDFWSEEAPEQIYRSMVDDNTKILQKLNTAYNKSDRNEEKFYAYLCDLYGEDLKLLKERIQPLKENKLFVEEFPEKFKFTYSSLKEKKVLSTLKEVFNIRYIPSKMKIPSPEESIYEYFLIDFIVVCDVLKSDLNEIKQNEIPEIETEIMLVGEYFGYTLSESDRRKFDSFLQQRSENPNIDEYKSLSKNEFKVAQYDFKHKVKVNAEDNFAKTINCNIIHFTEPKTDNPEEIIKMIKKELTTKNILFTVNRAPQRDTPLGRLITWYKSCNQTDEQKQFLSNFLNINNPNNAEIKIKSSALSFILATEKELDAAISRKILEESIKITKPWMIDDSVIDKISKTFPAIKDQKNQIKSMLRNFYFDLSPKEMKSKYLNLIRTVLGESNYAIYNQELQRIIIEQEKNIRFKLNSLNENEQELSSLKEEINKMRQSTPSFKVKFQKINELKNCIKQLRLSDNDLEKIIQWCNDIKNKDDKELELLTFCENTVVSFNLSKNLKTGSFDLLENKTLMYNITKANILKNIVRLSRIADILDENTDSESAEATKLIDDEIGDLANDMPVSDTIIDSEDTENLFPRVPTPTTDDNLKTQGDIPQELRGIEEQAMYDVINSSEFSDILPELEQGKKYDKLKSIIFDKVNEKL